MRALPQVEQPQILSLPESNGRCVVLAGLSYSQRQRVLAHAGPQWLAAGRTVLVGELPPPPQASGPNALYAALMNSAHWAAQRHRNQTPAALATAGVSFWVEQSQLVESPDDLVLVILGVDATQPELVEFFTEFAKELHHVSPAALVLLNPLGGPGLIPEQLTCTAAQLSRAQPAEPLRLAGNPTAVIHPKLASRLTDLGMTTGLRDFTLTQAEHQAEIQLLDGVWLPGPELTIPKLGVTHSAVSQQILLTRGQRWVLGVLSAVGPLSWDELRGILEQLAPPEITAGAPSLLGGLLERALVQIRAGQLDVPNPVLQASARGMFGPAMLEQLAQVRAAGRCPAPVQLRFGPQAASLAQVLADPADCDGELLLDWARWARAQGGVAAGPSAQESAVAAALSAIILAGRGRVDRAQAWVGWAGQNHCPATLLAYAKAVTAEPLSSPGPVPYPELTAPYWQVRAELAAWAKRSTELDAAPDSGLTEQLNQARIARLVLLWAQLAELARSQGVPVGATPKPVESSATSWHPVRFADRTGPTPAGDDLRSALLSMLAVGWSTPQCAQALALSTRAIEKRITALYRMSQFGSRTTLVREYLEGAFGNLAS